MDAKLLPSICPAPSIFPIKSLLKTSNQNPSYLPLIAIRRRKLTRPLTATSDSTNNSNSAGDQDVANGDATPANINTTNTTTTTPTRQGQPPSTPNIRYRSRSKRQAKQQREDQYRPPPPPPPKPWEDMTLGEKAVELYVGKKGLLFWLNKFAYASIFIIIGGWILFRFVGPAFNLYQLDGSLLSPDSVFKGS